MTDEGNREKQNNHLLASPVMRLFLVLAGVCLAYAVLRYNVFKGVPLAQLPVYVLNKTVCFVGVACLSISYVVGKVPVPGLRGLTRQLRSTVAKELGLLGYSLVMAHVFMSLAILNPAYFAKLYDGAKLSFAGELHVLFGVVALWCFSLPALASMPTLRDSLGADNWLRIQRAGYIALLMTAGHVFVIGYGGWLKPEDWPGGMPPITLVTFIISIVPLVVRFGGRSGPSLD